MSTNPSETPENTETGVSDTLSRFFEGSKDLNTPDVTKAQAGAFAQAIVAALVIFGVKPEPHVTAAVAALSTAILIILPFADAWIRRERARQAMKIATARKLQRSDTSPLATLRNELAATRARGNGGSGATSESAPTSEQTQNARQG